MVNTFNKNILLIIVGIAVALMAWAILTTPDQRTTGQKIGDAVDTLPHGIDKAAKQLESRTPGQKVGDAVKDAGDNIKDATAAKKIATAFNMPDKARAGIPLCLYL